MDINKILSESFEYEKIIILNSKISLFDVLVAAILSLLSPSINFFKKNEYNKIVNHMINDKKNNDKKLNLILLREIGKTTPPNKYKMTTGELKKIFYRII